MSSPGPPPRRNSSVRASPAPRTGLRMPGSNIPRTSVRMNATRASNSQPSYDFITGATGNSPPPAPGQTRNALRRSQSKELVRSDPVNEQLRADIKALQYELSSFQSDRELDDLRQTNELRDAQKRAEEDFKKAQDAEASKNVALRRYEILTKEFHEQQDETSAIKQELEQKVRRAQERNQKLQEQLDEVLQERETQQREHDNILREREQQMNNLQRSLDQVRAESQDKENALRSSQQRLGECENEVGSLESEILRLKAQTGDVDTLGVIKRELSEQVAHIKKLESTNRDQNAELKHFRKLHQSVEVVEEEKRVLEQKVQMMEGLRQELSEAQLQKQILIDERKAWTTYLEQEATDEELHFESPEDLARALVQERIERLSVVEQMGNFAPELQEKDGIIKSLERDLQKLKEDLDKQKGGENGDARKVARLERQRALAVKEVEYLREQLQTFDTEETTFQPEKFDEQKTNRIKELEGMVDQYRKELSTLNEDLAKHDKALVPEPSGTKRPREEEPDERLGLLSRKNRKLQDENSKLLQSNQILKKDLSAQKAKFDSKAAQPTRILEFRNNPTATIEAVKLSTLRALKEENASLLAQLEGRPSRSSSSTKTVPLQTLENARRDISDMEKTVADKEKRMLRLKQIWSSKSLEFREAVASILGWKMDFLPNGCVRVTSLLYPASDDDGGEENSIVFDAEKGTMKISGGPNSLFAMEIRQNMKFWVEGRKEVPCFLAACTLEFYDKSTKAAMH